MKNLLLALALLLTLQGSSQNTTAINDIRLLPQPNHMVFGTKTLDLKSGLRVQEHHYSSFLKEELTRSGIPTTEGIPVTFKEVQIDSLGAEGYQLIGTSEKVTILSNTDQGAFYGIQTLLQLAQRGPINTFNITDSPRFSWRAYMLDEARHFQGKETVKALLDEMARLKMNIFHWHLTDDAGWRIEIKKYPLLTEVGSRRDSTQINDNGKKWKSSIYDGVPHQGFYTQQDIREIVAYAADRNITIIPEISMPGHASAAVASYPWLGTLPEPIKVPAKFGVLKTVYNPANQQTMVFIHDVLKEVSALFPSGVIHIGGDEVKFDQWKNSEAIMEYMKTHQLETYSDVQVNFTNEISNYIQDTLGKRMMGWNEIMGLRVHEWSEQEEKHGSTTLSKNAIIHFWKGAPENLKKAIDAGHQLVNSTHQFTYLDYTCKQIDLKKAYSFDPVPEGFSQEEAKQILGLGTQMWGEWTPTKKEVYRQTFPRIAAYAETGWTNAKHKDFHRFKATVSRYISDLANRGIYVSDIDECINTAADK